MISYHYYAEVVGRGSIIRLDGIARITKRIRTMDDYEHVKALIADMAGLTRQQRTEFSIHSLSAMP